MVLKNSKWDKKAKYAYLKKHGLNRKTIPSAENVSPKWSDKQRLKVTSLRYESDNESEYDSEEEDAFLSQFFPQLGESELSKEQKQKIKRQILQEIEETAKQKDNEEVSEQDGIYLGSEEKRIPDLEHKLSNIKLDEFVSRDLIFNKTKKNRKHLKNKVSDGLLEEYGINYQDTIKPKDDYNDLYYTKESDRNLAQIPTEDLIGFKVGESSFKKDSFASKPEPRKMTEKEQIENEERLKKSKQSNFYNQIKNKFGDTNNQASAKVLEINNFDLTDERQMKSLNSRISKEYTSRITELDQNQLDLVIGELMDDFQSGVEDKASSSQCDDIDEFLQSLNKISEIKVNVKSSPSKGMLNEPVINPGNNDEDFLDDLLG